MTFELIDAVVRVTLAHVEVTCVMTGQAPIAGDFTIGVILADAERPDSAIWFGCEVINGQLTGVFTVHQGDVTTRNVCGDLTSSISSGRPTFVFPLEALDGLGASGTWNADLGIDGRVAEVLDSGTWSRS